jgi:hypothetical protein
VGFCTAGDAVGLGDMVVGMVVGIEVSIAVGMGVFVGSVAEILVAVGIIFSPTNVSKISQDTSPSDNNRIIRKNFNFIIHLSKNNARQSFSSSTWFTKEVG